jgi:hypothetical protein
MVAMRELEIGDVVELTETADSAPAGAQGGVTDILDEDRVIVEVTTLPPEPILDRVIIVPPAMLRIVRGQAAA